MHIYLSPHFDDAALSCGGQIAQLTAAGEHVLIFTLMAGRPATDFTPTAFTRELEARWGTDSDPISVRQREDQAAAATLGASLRHLSFADAPYRTDLHHTTLYPTWESIITTTHPAEPLTPERLFEAILDAVPTLSVHDVLYAPLGAGEHIDHRLTREAVRWGQTQHHISARFYEDYPYTVNDPVAVERAVRVFATTNPPRSLRRLAIPIADRAVDVKIRAIAQYQSQISSFWADLTVMADQVRRDTAGGEFIWV